MLMVLGLGLPRLWLQLGIVLGQMMLTEPRGLLSLSPGGQY
jgi:hypothetical protein